MWVNATVLKLTVEGGVYGNGSNKMRGFEAGILIEGLIRNSVILCNPQSYLKYLNWKFDLNYAVSLFQWMMMSKLLLIYRN